MWFLYGRIKLRVCLRIMRVNTANPKDGSIERGASLEQRNDRKEGPQCAGKMAYRVHAEHEISRVYCGE
jgi:hypothetical protein